MENLTAILEIGSQKAKLLLCYLFHKQIKVVYTKTIKLNKTIDFGDYIDVYSLKKDISTLIEIDDSKLGFKYTLNNVTLLIPPVGLEVYQIKKTMKTSSPDEITSFDIKSVMRQIVKEPVPNNNVIINVIPDTFIIDGKQTFKKAPIGFPGGEISIDAHVYTLPQKMYNALVEAITGAGLTISGVFISNLCATSYLTHNNYKNEDYILVEVAEKSTILNLIKDKKVIDSKRIFVGSDDIDEVISKEFDISLEEAENLKKLFINDTSNTTYNPLISKTNNGIEITKSSVMPLINRTIEDFASSLGKMIEVLNEEAETIDDLPIFIYGNEVKFDSLKDYLANEMRNKKIDIIKSNVIGAPFDEYGNLIGTMCLKLEIEENINDKINAARHASLLHRQGGEDHE